MRTLLLQARALCLGFLFLSGVPLNGATTTTTITTTAALVCNCDAEAVEEGMPMAVALPVILVLICLSGLFSGLTLGLMGLDLLGLETIINGGNPVDAKCAAKIKPIREKGNMLLCTLLLGNVAVNSALAILTAGIPFLNGMTGFLVSTVLIVIFGEIIPQATCAKYALQIGSATVPLVKGIMLLMLIIVYPMSLVLDVVLGKDLGQLYSTDELIEMVKLQISNGGVCSDSGEELTKVMRGCLRLRDTKVKNAMTPVSRAYMLSCETRLSYETVREIFEKGFSRIPVFGRDRNDCVGLLSTKDLILADPDDQMRVADFIQIFQRQVLNFHQDMSLQEAMKRFKESRKHLALVRSMDVVDDKFNPDCNVVGIVTLEDVVEEILGEDIIDEDDVHVDIARDTKLAGPRQSFNLGIFNPIWQSKKECLTVDEIRAVSAHLSRELFGNGSRTALSAEGVDWLVKNADVQSRERVALPDTPPDQADRIYQIGQRSDKCTLILQGRACVQMGSDGFEAEAGAFKILARDALIDEAYVADFNASVSSSSVRYLSITSNAFKEAKKNPSERKEVVELSQGKPPRSERKETIAPGGGQRKKKQGLTVTVGAPHPANVTPAGTTDILPANSAANVAAEAVE